MRVLPFLALVTLLGGGCLGPISPATLGLAFQPSATVIGSHDWLTPPRPLIGPESGVSGTGQEAAFRSAHQLLTTIDFGRFRGRRVAIPALTARGAEPLFVTPRMAHYVASLFAEGVLAHGGQVVLDPSEAEEVILFRLNLSGHMLTHRSYQLEFVIPVIVQYDNAHMIQCDAIVLDERAASVFSLRMPRRLATIIEPYLVGLFSYRQMR